MKKLAYGFLKFYDARKGFGFICSEICTRDLYISEGPRFVQAGTSSPEFTDMPEPQVLGPTDGVVLYVDVQPYKMPVVTTWGSLERWEAAMKEISARPVYRVVRENRFRGQLMSREVREQEIVRGTIHDLLRFSVPDGKHVSSTDKLAPIYRSGPCTAVHHFSVRNADGTWAACTDPRPIPGPIFRLMFWKDGKSVQIETGKALELSRRRPIGKDGLDEYRTQAGEAQGYLYWERHESDVPPGEKQWTEVGDPRFALDSVESKSAPEPAKKPVAMPKRAEREFKKVVNSFEDLVLAN